MVFMRKSAYLGGNNDLIVNADYVGIGTYSDFKGLKKLTAYWL